MKRYLSEFCEFARKGSVLGLAVAVVIGVAFGKIVESAVNDIIVPVVAGLLGKADFSGLFIALANPPAVPPTLEALKKAGVPIIAYGNFLVTVLNFALLALVIVMVVRYLDRLGRRAPSAQVAPPSERRESEG